MTRNSPENFYSGWSRWNCRGSTHKQSCKGRVPCEQYCSHTSSLGCLCECLRISKTGRWSTLRDRFSRRAPYPTPFQLSPKVSQGATTVPLATVATAVSRSVPCLHTNTTPGRGSTKIPSFLPFMPFASTCGSVRTQVVR